MGSVGTEAADAVMGKENADNIRQRKKINICFALSRHPVQAVVIIVTVTVIIPVVVTLLTHSSKQRAAMEALHNSQLREALQIAKDANEAKSTFLSNMSHDIRTPLNGIIGLIDIDMSHFDDRELVLENHTKMKTSANHLLSLINDVLQMSKLEDGKANLTHELISLVDLTRDIVNIIHGCAVEAGIEWNFEKNKSVIPYPYIYGSPLHLRQIFLNIYGNCIKYNRPDGKITTIVDNLEEHGNICTYR